MMDIRPLLASPDLLSSSRDIRPIHSVFVPRDSTTMIIDDNNHNSSMPVSPKQGETITADRLVKQEPQLVSNSWEHMSSQSKPIFSPSANQLGPSLIGQNWPSTSPNSLPIDKINTMATVLNVAENYQSNKINNEIRFDSWKPGKDPLNNTATSSPATSSPRNQSSPTGRRDLEENDEPEELPSMAISATKMSARNCDRPDSSPSPQSQLNSSFDESEHTATDAIIQNGDSFNGNNINIYESFKRRSRRKPTTGDIVRRIIPPVDAPPYDSEESEIEDDILRDEMMAAKMSREHQGDEVDGMRLATEGDYRENGPHQFTVTRLSRLEAADGMPEEDEEEEEEDDDDMEIRSESDSIGDSDKHAFLKDVPVSIYNLMHEVKVNAHTMFMKTAKSMPPAEAKVRREQYLLQLLSNLRDRCLMEGLQPEVIGAILKDVETEVTFFSEDFEDIKIKQYFSDSDKESSYNTINGNETNFLTRPDIKIKDDKEQKETSSHIFSSAHPPSFLTAVSSSSSSPIPVTSSSSSSSPSSDSKPIIVTVSADMKLHSPMAPTRGGLPHHPLASSISEHAFSPMFNNKLNPWFPPSLVNSMAMYNFSSPGPLDHILSRKYINLEGKIGDNVDKDYLKCQFCERTFRRQKNLENHIENTHQGKGQLKPRRDTNDMYFKCSHCPYTTKHQSNLYVHLRIHTGERPYICGACGVQYSQSHSLKSHIINKHDGVMSFYIKEKRARSPRGMSYLSAQVMHDANMFKLPPPMMGSPMHHNNLDIVNKAIEFATSETAKHQQHLKQQHNHHFSPLGSDSNSQRSLMPPPPLTSLMSTDNNNASNNNNNNQAANTKSPATPSTGQGSGPNTPTPNNSNNNNNLFNAPAMGPNHPFFINGHHLMFGELPPHLRNHNQGGHHPPIHHPFLPGFPPFPPNNPVGFHGPARLSPISPNSSPATSTPVPHHTLPPHLQLPLSHLTPSPIPLLQKQQIKKEPQGIHTTPVLSKQVNRSQPEEAIDLRKKSPPPETKEQHAYDLNICGRDDNCDHAAKLKDLRLNVVRMLGILVPNLNFAEKGISAESESVDELLQDVIESNTHDDDME